MRGGHLAGGRVATPRCRSFRDGGAKDRAFSRRRTKPCRTTTPPGPPRPPKAPCCFPPCYPPGRSGELRLRPRPGAIAFRGGRGPPNCARGALPQGGPKWSDSGVMLLQRRRKHRLVDLENDDDFAPISGCRCDFAGLLRGRGPFASQLAENQLGSYTTPHRTSLFCNTCDSRLVTGFAGRVKSYDSEFGPLATVSGGSKFTTT